MIGRLCVVLAILLTAGCERTASGEPLQSARPSSPGPTPVSGDALRYVALGDSYTIGTSVAIDERWPNQLAAALGTTPPSLDLVANLAVNGYTSGDVLGNELPLLDGARPEFISLLIGVNDVVQGVPETTFRRNVDAILGDLVDRVGPERIVVVTTPDYTVTPAGGDYGDPAAQSLQVRRYNEILTMLATGRGIAVVDIHDLSLRAGSDPTLVARDGLHPSGAQYALWVERIRPAVAVLLGR